MVEQLSNGWKELLASQQNETYYKNLQHYLAEQYENETVYPKREDIFKALQLTDYADVKVVLLGQDPYHGEETGVRSCIL